jgi:hypothetical protein
MPYRHITARVMSTYVGYVLTVTVEMSANIEHDPHDMGVGEPRDSGNNPARRGADILYVLVT